MSCSTRYRVVALQIQRAVSHAIYALTLDIHRRRKRTDRARLARGKDYRGRRSEVEELSSSRPVIPHTCRRYMSDHLYFFPFPQLYAALPPNTRPHRGINGELEGAWRDVAARAGPGHRVARTAVDRGRHAFGLGGTIEGDAACELDGDGNAVHRLAALVDEAVRQLVGLALGRLLRHASEEQGKLVAVAPGGDKRRRPQGSQHEEHAMRVHLASALDMMVTWV